MFYKIASIVILALFYSIYFGKLILQRRVGIKTNQMGKGDKPKKVYIIEMLLKLITIIIVVAEVTSIILDWNFAVNWVRIIGVVLSLFGVIIFFIAVYTMKDSWRAGISTNNDTKLISNGIYKISRNPAFLGFDLLYIGILLIYFNWILLGITAFAIILFHIQILQEEKYLPSIFGQEYIDYRKRVFRYFGRRLLY